MSKPLQDIVADLREDFPHGHPRFLPITLKEVELHSLKNHDYASGGSALGNFDRVSAILALYPRLTLNDRRVVALVYALKQLDAVLWGLSEGIEHKVEGLNPRLQDISVYAKIVQCMNEDMAAGGTHTKLFKEPNDYQRLRQDPRHQLGGILSDSVGRLASPATHLQKPRGPGNGDSRG